MTKRLIVNADDFGRTPGVTEGILRAHRDGIVTSSTAMMNMPGVAAALQRARRECPRLGLGVHLVFTSGQPLLPPGQISSLVDESGSFLSKEAIRSDPDQLDLGQLRAELKAQIEAFRSATGGAPDHLDAHHFAHLLPRFFEIYLELAQRSNLPARIPLPRNEADLASRPPLGLSVVPPEQLENIVRANWALMKQRPVDSPDHFEYRFFGDEALALTYLLDLLGELPEGTTELMTHPGLADKPLCEQSRYNVQREKELALLCDPAIKRHLAELDVQLITFADLNSMGV